MQPKVKKNVPPNIEKRPASSGFGREPAEYQPWYKLLHIWMMDPYRESRINNNIKNVYQTSVVNA